MRRFALCVLMIAGVCGAEETPQRKLCVCHDTFQVAQREAERAAAEPQVVAARAAAGSRAVPVVDVMMLYTSAAASGAGGAAKLEANIVEHFQMTNQLYVDNLINLRIRLVHKTQVDYAESGSPQTDIARLLSSADGFMDNVPVLRDQFGADLVCLLTENTASIGGVGYVAVTNGQGSPDLGYSIVKRTRIVNNNFTFAHELGHNMGCQHDVELDGPDPATGQVRLAGAFAYSYGHHFTADGKAYDTIMSEFGGLRTSRFSSPNLTYLGQITGIADKADNARSINEAAATVAAFRPTVVPDDGSGGTTPSIDSNLDSDADGFSDELETALGTGINDAASTPFGGSSVTAQAFTLSKINVRLNFARSLSDSIKLSGTLPVPDAFTVSGKVLVVNVGGAIASFTLDGKGAAVTGTNKAKLRVKSSKGIVAAQSSPLNVSFSKGSFAGKFADEQLSSMMDAKFESKSVPVVVLFNTALFTVKQNVLWTAKAGKSGTAKQP